MDYRHTARTAQPSWKTVVPAQGGPVVTGPHEKFWHTFAPSSFSFSLMSSVTFANKLTSGLKLKLRFTIALQSFSLRHLSHWGTARIWIDVECKCLALIASLLDNMLLQHFPRHILHLRGLCKPCVCCLFVGCLCFPSLTALTPVCTGPGSVRAFAVPSLPTLQQGVVEERKHVVCNTEAVVR